MARVTTLPQIYRPLMEAPTIRASRCVICGRSWPLNQHHVVWRSWGEMYLDGKRLDKPTVTLCGHGNVDGCHGLAHHRRLHFRVLDGRFEYLVTDKPTRYDAALQMGGWREVRWPEW